MTATTVSTASGPPVPTAHRADRRPRWSRPALAALLLTTGLLYLWGLGASGWANAFYSAAVQAGATSWKAFFFGSSDASNFITVDKTPAALWVMDLSARVFGVNAWSILVPQALEGVAAVWVLYATVRRWFGAAAGLLAGTVLALTPVAVLMFRFNNPDALLTLLLVAAAYATVRAVERANPRWLALAGAAVGLGFLAKMMQALLVVPILAAVYLVAAPTALRRRIGHLALAGLAMLAAGGWWVVVVELVPAADRPYIGGSQHNSVLELMFGYNGFGRLDGQETGSVGGVMGWGQTGWDRLFGADMGGQIAWLLPAALILLTAGLWAAGRAPRTDRTRAGFLLWGGTLVVTAVLFSYMQGIIHPYYTVALAPAIGALVGMGVTTLWRIRHRSGPTAVLAAAVAVTAVWSFTLLGRDPGWYPWLRPLVLVTGLAAAAALLTAGRLPRPLLRAATVVALLAGLAGPAAYALDTAATTHSGALPTAGPAAGLGFGGPGGGGGGFGGGGPRGGGGGGAARAAGPAGMNGSPSGAGAGPRFGGGAGFPGRRAGGGAGDAIGGRGGPAGGMGGLLGTTTPDAAMVNLLKTDASRYRWVAAVVGSNDAAGYQLATSDPVMAIGGFNGTDNAPSLTQFQRYVSSGQVHYFIAGGLSGAASGGSDVGSQISTWVAQHFRSSTVGGQTVYDLSAPITP
ncbi:MAG TPA: glycosyltransferase family 39 protein [Rugosimonospora sp.]